jgi:hypothetical protein
MVFQWNITNLQSLMASVHSSIKTFGISSRLTYCNCSTLFMPANLTYPGLFGEIVLLPKIKVAERIWQYGLVCRHNLSFKIFTIVATNRLNAVVDHVVRPSQTTFMQGRNILDGVVILYKTVLRCTEET